MNPQLTQEELIADACRRLGLDRCPRCLSGGLNISCDPPRITCTGGCTNVAGAVYQIGCRLTGEGVAPQREVILRVAAAASRLEANRSAPEFQTRSAAARETAGSVAVRVVSLGDIDAKGVPWLWPDRLPAGMIAVVDGPPGAGKSSIVCDLTARLTRGRPWPGATEGREPRNVVLLGHEDSPEYTLRPRLDAAGADPDRVRLLMDIGGRLPRLPDDAAAIEQAVVDAHAALLVIDPMTAYLGRTDLHRDNEVRSALLPLATLAERTGAAVLLIRHLRKSGGTDAIYRGLGSVGTIALARTGLMVLPDPDDPTARVLAWTKLSVGPLPQSLRWRFDESAGGKPPRVAWDEAPCVLTADAILDREDQKHRGRGQEGPSVVDRAEEMLMEMFEDRGEIPAADVLSEAARQGITEKSLRAARQRVGIRRRRQNTGGRRGAGRWVWTAPGFKAADNPNRAGLNDDDGEESSNSARQGKKSKPFNPASDQGYRDDSATLNDDDDDVDIIPVESAQS